MKISVIVPIYNVENLIERCLSSLLIQTVFNELEILLIDDGSTDRSGIICDAFAEKYENIKVFHKANSGVSAARNFGLNQARGKYVVFVDADDYVSSDFYEKMLFEIETRQVDLVVFDYYLQFENGDQFTYRTNAKPILWNNEQALIEILRGGLIGQNLFDKMFRRKTIGKLRFDESIKIGEDLLFIFFFLTNAKKVFGKFTPGYFYYQREGSAMNGGFSEKSFDILIVAEKMQRWIDMNYKELSCYGRAAYIHSAYKTLERAYKAQVYNLYEKRLNVLKKEIKNYSIICAYKYLSKKQFFGFVLMKVSPKLYLIVCKIKNI